MFLFFGYSIFIKIGWQKIIKFFELINLNNNFLFAIFDNYSLLKISIL